MRVVIADDSVLWREGLAQLLAAAGIEPCALVGDAAALRDAVAEHHPDVALIDVRMPPTWTHEGAEAASDLRQAWPTLGLLLLSQSVESRHATGLARTHPRGFGYLLKDRVINVATLVDALATVTSGGTVLDPDVVAGLLGRDNSANRLGALSPREREVLALMAQGRSNGAIARHLFLTPKTVETHIAAIMTKLGLPPERDDHRRVLAVLAYLDA
ncbi:response regulator transcription factor [Frankia sp. Cas3]|uniref:response regulator transcription factor n=1 Tax=Frankia sp. Cas3 TaxID=3073926 RepID=UPI002AD43961|nr:response regulator transcription factor [Frankia sp. Cas3]